MRNCMLTKTDIYSVYNFVGGNTGLRSFNCRKLTLTKRTGLISQIPFHAQCNFMSRITNASRDEFK